MALLRPAGDFDETYSNDMAIMRRPWQFWITVAAVAVAYTLPLWSGHMATINRIAYTIVALQGLNILTGMSGQVSLGQASFMLVGGYLSGLLMIHWGLPIFVTLPLAGLGTGLFGLIFGLPSLRVKGFYLAMATLAAQFIIPWLSRNTFKEYLGGGSGAIAVPFPTIGGIEFNTSASFFYISLTVLIITTILTTNISRTRLGRAFVSLRDNDLAAELLGVNLFGYKLRAFFIAALLAGVAGALKAHTQRGVGTEFGYGLNDSVIFLGMLVVGGMGTNLGPYFGAILVLFLEDFALGLGDQLAILFPGQAAGLSTSFRPIFFGLVLMLFLIFEPRGLAHRWELLKASWRLRPFAR